MTLRSQLLLALGLLAALPVFFLGVTQVRSAEEGEIARADRETLLASTSLARELGRVLEGHANVVRALAAELGEKATLDAGSIAIASTRVVRHFPGLYCAFVVNAEGITIDGTLRTGARESSMAGTVYRDRAWYQEVREGAGYASELLRSRVTGHPAAIVAARIAAPDGTLRAIAGVGIDLGGVQEALERVTHAAPGLAGAVVDVSGRLVAAAGARPPQSLEDVSSLPLYQPATGASAEARRGRDLSGETRRGAASRVESAAASWSVVATWPQSLVRERAQRALETALAFALGALALGLAVAVVLSRVLAQPVVRVSSLLEAIGRGDLRGRRADVGAWDAQELGQLHGSIASTREGLQRLMAQLGGTTAAVRLVTQRLREASERMLVDSRVQQDAVHRSGGAIVHMSDSIAHVGSSVRDLSNGASETTASILSLDQHIERIARSLGTLTRTIGAAQGEVDETERQLGAVRDSTRQLGHHVDRTNELLRLLTESIESVAGRAERARTLGRGVLAAAESGRVAVEETIAATREIHRRFQAIGAAVRALEGRSESIGEIASVLEKVMHATRLLGLNASIIASEAGDQGKRFAVVADRVRAMATETGHSIEEITKLVASVQADIVQAGGAVRDGQQTVQAGERCSQDAGVRLQAIIQSSGESEHTVEEIASLSRDQAQRVRLVNEALTGVRGATDRIEDALQAQHQAQEKMSAAIREVRLVGDEVRRSTEAQQTNSQAMTSAVKAMTSRVQSIADSVEGQNRERAHMQRSLEVFEEASKSSVDRSSQIGDVVRTLSDRLEQLEQQLRAFQFD